MQQNVVRYEPRGAALELFKNRNAEVALSGPAGTGKSLACLFRLHLTALANPGVRFLIARKTAVSLGSTTLVTFEKRVAAKALATGVASWFGGSTREAACYRYDNGSVIVVGGLDKPQKIMSSEYDIAFADEATELTVDDWEAIGTRLRNGALAWQQQIAACNPAHPSHWLKQRADRGPLTMLHSRHRDNPAYVNTDGSYTPAGAAYMAKLDALTGIRRTRLYEGKWSAAEGLVYEGWDPAVHLIDALPERAKSWTRWWGIDFGYSNPFCLQCYAEDPDGRLYLYREIYMSRRLVEDHAKVIKKIVCPDGAWIEPPPRAIVADHDAEDRATFERHFGMSTQAARKSVSDGVQAMQARLKIQPDGKPRFYVVAGCLVELDKELAAAKRPTSFVEEIAGYVWPDGVKPDKREAPVKEDDHSMDTARYVIAARDLGSRPGIRVM